MTKNKENKRIQAALDRASKSYIQTRRQKIPEFIETHFSVKGALRINKKALGPDLIKAPANVAWAVPYTAVQVMALISKKAGITKISRLAKKMPSGFKTAVQQEINRLIFTELLELPYQDDKKGFNKDALLAEILDQPEIQILFQDQLALIRSKSKAAGFKKALEERLKEYTVSRTAVSELAANIITLATGAGLLGKITPGGISFGTGLAAAIAQQSAISSFIFGPTLGAFYYGIFPASASLGLMVASTSAVLAILAMLAAFSGIITDPLQAKLGLHKKRLNQLVDSLEASLKDETGSNLKLKEQYLVRVFDLLDLFKAAAQTLI
ncbi:MAG: hypothetical protein GY729_00570 [Desulfobacteraceae bacterium]|nr:hypothetical protein [Desulfobacteraceae bacterium]